MNQTVWTVQKSPGSLDNFYDHSDVSTDLVTMDVSYLGLLCEREIERSLKGGNTIETDLININGGQGLVRKSDESNGIMSYCHRHAKLAN